MADLDDLMDVADIDPNGERVRVALERLGPDELLETAAQAVQFGALARTYMNYEGEDY